ncbi:MAG: cytochrome b/b6 domain-containing protein [Alphaproteobacteria bacterium]|nr:cytochrome b/b6 domain-containing protein [Alphaproteobacteria bacterium]
MTVVRSETTRPARPLSRFGRWFVFGANARSGRDHRTVYRHQAFVRVLHWVNAGVMLVMLMSGLQIFNAHPALYLGRQSDFDHPLLAMNAVEAAGGELKGVTVIGPWHFDTTGVLGASDLMGNRVARGFPAWATLPATQWLAMGRRYHFFFAWIFVADGVLFTLLSLLSGHLQRQLLPEVHDFAAIPREIADHARLRFVHDERALRYNALQRLTYFAVIFLLGPLIVLTGLTMSPTMDSAFPFLPILFGGRQTARTIHFLCAFSFVGFFLVHIVMVVLSGTWNNLRSMITGRYAIETDATNV